MKFVSKRVEIDAIQFTGSDSVFEMAKAWKMFELRALLGEENKLVIFTLEGNMCAQLGDWIIKGTEGEFYPCKDSVFKRKYEAVI